MCVCHRNIVILSKYMYKQLQIYSCVYLPTSIYHGKRALPCLNMFPYIIYDPTACLLCPIIHTDEKDKGWGQKDKHRGQKDNIGQRVVLYKVIVQKKSINIINYMK